MKKEEIKTWVENMFEYYGIRNDSVAQKVMCLTEDAWPEIMEASKGGYVTTFNTSKVAGNELAGGDPSVVHARHLVWGYKGPQDEEFVFDHYGDIVIENKLLGPIIEKLLKHGFKVVSHSCTTVLGVEI